MGLAELENLQLLHLDGEWSREIWNGALIQLPEALGSLHCLQSLTRMNFESLQSDPGAQRHLTSVLPHNLLNAVTKFDTTLSHQKRRAAEKQTLDSGPCAAWKAGAGAA